MTRLALLLGWILLPASLTWRPTAAQVDAGAERSLPAPFTHAWSVRGYGVTEEIAREDALREAIGILGKLLEAQSLHAWKPDGEFVKSNLLEGPGTPGPGLTLPDLGPTCTWELRLRPLDPDRARLLDAHASRKLRERHRGEWMFRLVVAALAGTVLLAGAVWWKRGKHGCRRKLFRGK